MLVAEAVTASFCLALLIKIKLMTSNNCAGNGITRPPTRSIVRARNIVKLRSSIRFTDIPPHK